MYDQSLKLGTWAALLTLIAICMISSGTQFNGTIYHLGEKEVQVTVPVNGSQLNITLSEKTENMTLYDEMGKNVTFNSSYQFHRGDHIYSLTFERPIKGSLIYTGHLQGQQFILPIRDHEPVRIILPEGFTTGERSLGIARPTPDEFVEHDSGSILTWNNTTQIPYIEVNYYRRSAPQALMIILAILAITGLVLLAQYYISIRKLKAARMEVENEKNRKDK
ncbi:MAG: hypothetical protein JW999_05025 [Methanotrichaceae archaeon]|nr:hypothetical protein [Methanotrichaceae archaeon]